MKESIVKALRRLLLLSLALTACASPTSPVVATPEETGVPPTPTPTPAPYWDLLPLTAEPEGGWKAYHSEALNIAFQYPAVYDESECGEIWTKEIDTADAVYSVIGMPGTIQLHVFERWTGDAAEWLSAPASAADRQALTEVEQFSLGGMPAVRAIYQFPAQPDIDYAKVALVEFVGKLYQFAYFKMPAIGACDAPPLSEEEVYEHLLSTVEFTR